MSPRFEFVIMLVGVVAVAAAVLALNWGVYP